MKMPGSPYKLFYYKLDKEWVGINWHTTVHSMNKNISPLNLYTQYHFDASSVMQRWFLHHKSKSDFPRKSCPLINGKIALHHLHTPSQNRDGLVFGMNISVAENKN